MQFRYSDGFLSCLSHYYVTAGYVFLKLPADVMIVQNIFCLAENLIFSFYGLIEFALKAVQEIS